MPEYREKTFYKSVLQWFDSYANGQCEAEHEHHIDWLRAIPFIAMHLACLLVFVVGWSPFALLVAIAFYLLRMFAITAFYHRYFSHRAFKTHRVTQFLFAALGACAVQRGALWWAGHHRIHHAFSDKESDQHSPQQHGFFWSHVGWFLSRSNFSTRLERVKDFARYPELVFLDRYDVLVPLFVASMMYGLGELLAIYAPGLETNGTQLLVWGFFISTVILYHATFTINSLAHTTGWQVFPSKDDSRNNFLLSLITLGEGWHNNHHFYCVSARQGFMWWEIDPTYYGLKLMEKLGLIWELRPVPERIYQTREKIRSQS